MHRETWSQKIRSWRSSISKPQDLKSATYRSVNFSDQSSRTLPENRKLYVHHIRRTGLFQYVTRSHQPSYPAYVDYIIETGAYWFGTIGRMTVELEGIFLDALGSETIIPFYLGDSYMKRVRENRMQPILDLAEGKADAFKQDHFISEGAWGYQTGFNVFFGNHKITEKFSRISSGKWQAVWENIEPLDNLRFERPSLSLQKDNFSRDGNRETFLRCKIAKMYQLSR